MDRAILGITLTDRKTNDCIRQQTKMEDILTTITPCKQRWTGHVDRMDAERWIRKITEWRP